MMYNSSIDAIRTASLLVVMAGSPRSPEVVTQAEPRVSNWLRTTTRTTSWSIYAMPEHYRALMLSLTPDDKRVLCRNNSLLSTDLRCLTRLLTVRQEWSKR